MNYNKELKRWLDKDDNHKPITHSETRRRIFSRVRGVYIVNHGGNELYSGDDLDEAIRIWKSAVAQ